MAAKPITLGSLRFGKKGDAAAHLKAMLHKYDVGDKVSAGDAEVLRAALALHPDAKTKIGIGIAHFSVRSADFGTKCFWVNRTDGSTEKFSYKACIYS
jgi:Protein of unknown function (DUF3223)